MLSALRDHIIGTTYKNKLGVTLSINHKDVGLMTFLPIGGGEDGNIIRQLVQ